MEVNPMAIILVYLDSKGDRLLYRYPYQLQNGEKSSLALPVAPPIVPHVDSSSSIVSTGSKTGNDMIHKKRSRFALQNSDDLLQPAAPNSGHNIAVTKAGQLHGFADEVLAPLFAVKPQLCNQKFELKVNDVRFVSHPTLVSKKEHRTSQLTSLSASTNNQTLMCTPQTLIPAQNNQNTQKSQPHQMLVNIVFALHAQASYSIVKCYYDLSKRLGLALKVEEQRVGYLTEETVLMARTHDEVSSKQQPLEKAFDLISERCSLAQSLKSIYHDLCTTGLLNSTINQNLTLSFCLPAKAHQLHKKGSMVDPETIDHCLKSLKPYHGMLLLVDFAELLDCVPPAGARMLLQLIEVYTPLMSLQSMASDADLSIEHVNKLVSHLVYWAKATIIYPLCETNVYVIAPDAPLHTKSHLVEKFSVRFPGMSLFEVISDFSLPTSIGHLTTPLQQSARQGILAQMVLWMLQHHLLMQLHTYVQFMPSDLTDLDSDDDDDGGCELESASLMDLAGSILGQDDIILPGRSSNVSDDDLGAGSLLSMSSQPLPVPHTSRRSITEDRFSGGGSTTSDNIAAQPSSSHKSNFSMTASLSTDNCDSIASIEDEEKIKELIQVFEESDRPAIRRIPASANLDDLSLMVKLYQAGYFKSEHHLEEIMYFENLRRSQLLQLLDKFREVLIIYETEDPAIASMYNNKIPGEW
ncbi:Nitrogen permease regulator 3-like protein [Lucilia cuprina]|uniref:GATOR complex protein NPRL3 n=1 Tax=Lucilia cuprina TaxID=7375 RepID=A0A0L0BZM2_LUCCU|nr:Nitrogen permease regulator 3-like protein [Lucilia cuprina]KNC25527.1 Nitrogen permease regulator 3-like protein [Lucilia cuprina]